jgi:aminoglycoside 6-adenylyltransferase
VTDELRKSFAHYDKEDTRKALNASITLFTRMANETAQKLGYPYPTDTELTIKAWIEKTLR